MPLLVCLFGSGVQDDLVFPFWWCILLRGVGSLFVFFFFVLVVVLMAPCALSDGDGRITGSDAIKFFALSNLPRPDLKQVLVVLLSGRCLFAFRL